MSLTSHILEGKQSPIGRFLLERFSQKSSITNDANRQLRSANTIRPASPLPSYIYSKLGGAIDYRIRYSFDVTPSRKLLAWHGAWALPFKPIESDDDIRLSGDDWDGLSHIEGLVIPVGISAPLEDAARGPYSWKLIRMFFRRLDATLVAMFPPGRRLELNEEFMVPPNVKTDFGQN